MLCADRAQRVDDAGVTVVSAAMTSASSEVPPLSLVSGRWGKTCHGPRGWPTVPACFQEKRCGATLGTSSVCGIVSTRTSQGRVKRMDSVMTAVSALGAAAPSISGERDGRVEP